MAVPWASSKVAYSVEMTVVMKVAWWVDEKVERRVE